MTRPLTLSPAKSETAALAGGWPAIARWALPRAFAGTLAFAAIALALALVIPGA